MAGAPGRSRELRHVDLRLCARTEFTDIRSAAEAQKANLHGLAWLAVKTVDENIGKNCQTVRHAVDFDYRGGTLILGMGNPPTRAMGNTPIGHARQVKGSAEENSRPGC